MGTLVYKTSKTGKHLNYEMSDLQKLAQKENFALFTLVGMRSQLYHLKEVCSREELNALHGTLSKLELGIRHTQIQRKQLRNSKKASKAK